MNKIRVRGGKLGYDQPASDQRVRQWVSYFTWIIWTLRMSPHNPTTCVCLGWSYLSIYNSQKGSALLCLSPVSGSSATVTHWPYSFCPIIQPFQCSWPCTKFHQLGFPKPAGGQSSLDLHAGMAILTIPYTPSFVLAPGFFKIKDCVIYTYLSQN